MTIIEKIKAEIERLKKAQEVSEDKDYAQYELDVACGYDMACDDILSFLSTLESEHLADASKTLPNELEEAAGDYERTVNYGGDIYSNVAIRKAFIAGAKWQKEQMFNNAIEGSITSANGVFGYDVAAFKFDDDHKYIILLSHKEGRKYGDKVRITIVNEE